MEIKYKDGKIILVITYNEYIEIRSINPIFKLLNWDGNNKLWYSDNVKEIIEYCKENNINIININQYYIDTKLDRSKIPNYLFNFQKEAIEFLWECKINNYKGANLFFDVGTGKTITSLSFVNLFKEKKIIVAPNALKGQWKNEIIKFGIAKEEDIQIIEGTLKKRQTKYQNMKQYNIISYETLRADTGFILGEYFVICDEASKLKNRKTELYRKFNEFIKNSLFTIMLTATPYENNMGNIFNITRIHNKKFISYKDFFENFCITDEYGGKEFVVAYVGLEEFTELLKPFSLIKKKSDIATELPPLTFQNRIIDNTKQQNTIAKLLIKEDLFKNFTKLRMLDNGYNTFINNTNNISQKDFCEKTKELINIIEEIGDKKIIIFADYLASVNEISTALKNYNIITITGETKDKNDLIQKFKEKEKGILICTDVLSYGVSFSDIEYVINYNIHPNPAKMYQRVGRAARIDNPYSITIINLIGSSIEKYIMAILETKQTDINIFEITLTETDIINKIEKLFGKEILL